MKLKIISSVFLILITYSAKYVQRQSNIINFFKILFPFFLILPVGFYLFKLFFKQEKSLLRTLLGGFAISVFLNYFLVLILGLFNAVTYSALLIFYGILLLGLTIKTKLDFKIKINVYCLVILLLILFPIAYYQITQTKYLLIDTLPYVGSVQQVSSFNDYNAFSNNPSPLTQTIKCYQ